MTQRFVQEVAVSGEELSRYVSGGDDVVEFQISHMGYLVAQAAKAAGQLTKDLRIRVELVVVEKPDDPG